MSAWLRGALGFALGVVVAVPVAYLAVGALVVANPVGSVIDPGTGLPWGGDDLEHHGLVPPDPGEVAVYAGLANKGTPLNTTIGVVATDAELDAASVRRIAMSAHDGLARAIHPVHSPLDGDTLFCLSTGDGTGVDLETMLSLSTYAAEITAAAIVDAVVAAEPGFGLNTYFELTR